MADPLMEAAGVLHAETRLVVLPDDPALGELGKDFAGVPGTLAEYPGAVSATNPGFHGATEILKHKEMYARLEASPDHRVDSRALLKARLVDLLIGDWDRHRDQWRWAKLPGQPLWQPIADDRDQAFSRYEGLILAVLRNRQPRLRNYGPRYRSINGLTWNGWEQDRWLLTELARPVWREVAAELRAQITDAVIETAARRLPPDYFAIDGPRLLVDLKRRRDGLPEVAERYCRHLADKVDVYLTNRPERVDVERLDDGDVEVPPGSRRATGAGSGTRCRTWATRPTWVSSPDPASTPGASASASFPSPTATCCAPAGPSGRRRAAPITRASSAARTRAPSPPSTPMRPASKSCASTGSATRPRATGRTTSTRSSSSSTRSAGHTASPSPRTCTSRWARS